MRLKSRGLGRKELVMDFREYTVRRDGKEIVIEGTIREPVHWDFSIRMCEDDLPGVAKLAMSKSTIGLMLRSMFKRKKDAHWSLEREEHLKTVKETISKRKDDGKGDAGAKSAATKGKEDKKEAAKGKGDGSGAAAEPTDAPLSDAKAKAAAAKARIAARAGSTSATSGSEGAKPPAAEVGGAAATKAATTTTTTTAGSTAKRDAKPPSPSAEAPTKSVSFAKRPAPNNNAAAAEKAPDAETTDRTDNTDNTDNSENDNATERNAS